MPIPSRRLGQLRITREYSASTRHVELPAQEFIYNQAVSGLLLMIAALLALAWANSPWADSYFRLWDAEISFDFGVLHLHKSLHHWINDGLMTLFFFLVGMEIKGELLHGYLSSVRSALVPVLAALGGMIVPALLFLSLNAGTSTSHGWGIPMATDIAFAVAVLAMVPGVKHEIKVFLLALAIVDDIGAIVVIAFFYADNIHIAPLLAGGCLLLAIYALQRVRVSFAFPYVVLGILFWVTVLNSGIHATIAGVTLAFIVSSRPALKKQAFEERASATIDDFRRGIREGDQSSAETALGSLEALARATDPPIERLTRSIHPWVGFLVLPLFAFANSGVTLNTNEITTAITSRVFWGIVLGLVIGKPAGIVLFGWVAVKLRASEETNRTSLLELLGLGMLAGIGFTVAIFISGLAFDDANLVNIAKTAILAASTLAGILGFAMLRIWNRARAN